MYIYIYIYIYIYVCMHVYVIYIYMYATAARGTSHKDGPGSVDDDSINVKVGGTIFRNALVMKCISWLVALH